MRNVNRMTWSVDKWFYSAKAPLTNQGELRMWVENVNFIQISEHVKPNDHILRHQFYLESMKNELAIEKRNLKLYEPITIFSRWIFSEISSVTVHAIGYRQNSSLVIYYKWNVFLFSCAHEWHSHHTSHISMHSSQT